MSLIFWCAINITKNRNGIPRYLDAPLHDAFYEGGENLDMNYDWSWPTGTSPDIGSPLSFPSELWLIANHTWLNFDFFQWHQGILASEALISLLTENDLSGFKIAKLNVVNRNNDSISDKNMFYMKFKDSINIVNLDESDFQHHTYDDGRYMYYSDGRPIIDRLNDLKLIESNITGKNIIMSKDIRNPYRIFISDTLKNLISETHLEGVEFVSIDDYGKLDEQWRLPR